MNGVLVERVKKKSTEKNPGSSWDLAVLVLHKHDSGAVRGAPEHSLISKLKWEHIHLTSFSKWKLT